jgi:hypothetical protein
MSEADPVVQAAYEKLVSAWGAFGEAMSEAGDVGIDTQAVIAQLMRAQVSEEEWATLPAPVRMMLG